MVRTRPVWAWAALAVGTQPDGTSFPTLTSAHCAHLKNSVEKWWTGACASLQRGLRRLRLTFKPGLGHYQCAPALQNDARGIMRQRDETEQPGPDPQRSRSNEVSADIQMEDFQADTSALSLDDLDDEEFQAAKRRAEKNDAPTQNTRIIEEGDSQETRLLYLQASQKGAYTKADYLREIALATDNGDFEVAVSYLPPDAAGGKTTFIMQVPKGKVEAMLSFKWMLVKVCTEEEIRTRSNFLTSAADITILRIPASSYPFESGGGIKWNSTAFMEASALCVVRDLLQGAKDRADREIKQPTGVFESISEETMKLWAAADVDAFEVVNIEKEQFFRGGKPSKITENILIAVRLNGDLKGVMREGMPHLAPQPLTLRGARHVSLNSPTLMTIPPRWRSTVHSDCDSTPGFTPSSHPNLGPVLASNLLQQRDPDLGPNPGSHGEARQAAPTDVTCNRSQDLHVPGGGPDPEISRQGDRCRGAGDEGVLQAVCEQREEVPVREERRRPHRLHQVLPRARDHRALGGIVQGLDYPCPSAGDGQGEAYGRFRGGPEVLPGEDGARLPLARGGAPQAVKELRLDRENRVFSRKKGMTGRVTHATLGGEHPGGSGRDSMGIEGVTGCSPLQEPISHGLIAPLVQVKEWPIRRPKGMVPQEYSGSAPGRRAPAGFKIARGRNTVLSLRKVRAQARKEKLKLTLRRLNRSQKKARQRRRVARRHHCMEALRAAISRVRRWIKGEAQYVRALAFAMGLHKSPPAQKAEVTAPPNAGPRRGVAESQLPCTKWEWAWAWVRRSAREVWEHMKAGHEMLVACTPCRTWGFNVQRWIAWVSGEAYKPGPGTPTPNPEPNQNPDPSRHVGDLNIRFHNIRGMADKNFRGYYLAQARRACGILVLAETGCKASLELEWAQDWRGSGGVFWASGPPQERGHNARGMAVMISSEADVKNARLVAHDAGGRFIAVAMEISGHPMVIVGAHAEKEVDAAKGGDPDVQQAAFYARLKAEVPRLPGHRYIFAMDTNNVTDSTLDYWHRDSEPNSVDRPLAVQSMLAALDFFGATCDTFRCLHPDSREYTRSTPPSGKPRTRRRLDRIYASSALIRKAAVPRIKAVRHVAPGSSDLEALKQLGCKCSWSDHAAIDLNLQFSTHVRAKPPWSLPLHTLSDTTIVTKLMWPIRDKWIARTDLPPQERLEKMLDEIGKAVRAKTKADSKAHHAQKSRLMMEVTRCDEALGTDIGEASAAEHEACRERAIGELMKLHQREQTRWMQDRGYEQSAREDTCWRGFFEETREGRVNSHVQRLSGPGRMHSTMKGMFKEASRFFGAQGAIFNLRRAENASRQEQSDIEQARHALMDALRRDGKRVPSDMRQLLRLEAVLSDWNVQKAVDGLASNKAPGPDGWPAEFFKRMCPREIDKDGKEQPSPMAALIALVLKQCLNTGVMTPSMRQTVTTLLWKEKGTRHNLKYYRPITVTSVLYKILARSMVQAMRPVLPYLVATGQAAFQGDPKYIGDATRLCQDVIHYCDSEHTDGFLLFCDQDNAYPRVEWDFLERVMSTMGLHSDFIAMVNMMHVGLEGKFKINGHIGGGVKFSNALLQGDPCAPILYLLVIQSFISLVDTSNMKGIDVPGLRGDPTSVTHLRAVGFADDLLMFLRHPSQLTIFHGLFDIYAKASGAVLSLPKSFGMRIGRLRHSRFDLPSGWIEGRDIQITDDPVRYLGIFLGAPSAVKTVWESRITAKMQRRWANWRSRAMPKTRGGRNIINRNSVLSCGWYAVEGQWIPGLQDILEGWRQGAWNFFEGSNVGRGRSAVSRDVLIQDYHEMGVRCPDVESFVDALYVRWVRRLADPAPHPYKGLVYHWVNKAYGHLRQGHRLLISNCDFLCLTDDTPPFWSAVLQAFGSRRGLVPAVDQRGANPEVPYAEARAGAPRTVNVHPDLTFAEILMEPCMYNPNIGGWFGAKVLEPDGFERQEKARRPTVALFRGTEGRKQQARDYYQITLAYAQAGITHVIDLLTGLRPGQRLNLRPVDPLWPPVVQQTYMELLRGLPVQWLEQIRDARNLKARSPHLSWHNFVHQFPRSKDVWVQGEGGLITQLGVDGQQRKEWYVADPTERLRSAPCPSDPRGWLQRGVREVAVWEQREPPRCAAEQEARDRRQSREGDPAAPVYVLGGAVEDRRLLQYDPHTTRGNSAATDLSRFAWQYGRTDRERPSISYHVADTHSLYELRISRLFTPLRTFDLDAVPSLEHTVWTDLLLCRGEDGETVFRGEQAQRRGRVFSAQHMTGHDRAAKDLGYSVLADAWPVGNGRCWKKGQATHMLCDTCYRVYGRRIKETTRHIVLECRQAQLFLDLVWRAALEATCKDYNRLRATRRMSQRTLLRDSACVLVTACHPPTMNSDEPLITLVRAVQAELHRARSTNAMAAKEGVVQFNVVAMYGAVRTKLYEEGIHRHRAALALEAELRLRYPGWEPGEDGPVDKWERMWVRQGYLVGDECGLPSDPRSIPGAAYAAAKVGVRAVMNTRPCSEAGARVQLALKTWVWADLPALKVLAQVRPCGQGVRLRLTVEERAVHENDVNRRGRYETIQDENTSLPCVIYTDGGYHSGEGEIMGAERAGWGWVAVEGGDGIDDTTATSIARACGPVHLDPTSEGYVGADKLSNNTAEGQGLVEALMWLAHASSVPRGALVLIRPDSKLVVDWATGLTAAHSNHELVANLRRIYSQVSSVWNVRWAHVKGHSGHVWNDMADALAERGCTGEMLGYTNGKAVELGPTPPPLVAEKARYVWHVQRTVTIYFQAEKDEIVISSYFENRHIIDPSTVEYLPPNQYMPPHESPPPSQEHAVNSILRAWEHAEDGPSGRAHRLVYHSRPQDLVFDAGDMGQEDAQEWILHLLEAGLGEEVEDVRVRRSLGTWQGRVACTRYIRDLEADDLLDITGILTPQEQAASASQPASPPSLPPTVVPPPATSTPLLSPLAPPILSRLPSPMALPPQVHSLQDTPYSAPWTPLADQAIPQPHTEGGPARATIFAGWGEGGAELTREITVPAPQAIRPTPRRPFDALRTSSMCPPQVADSEHDEKRGTEEKAEVCSAAQSVSVSEEVGARGGMRLGLLGRARATLGRVASAIPRTLRNPFSLLRPDLCGGHDPPD